jgi:hypothetical protein
MRISVAVVLFTAPEEAQKWTQVAWGSISWEGVETHCKLNLLRGPILRTRIVYLIRMLQLTDD